MKFLVAILALLISVSAFSHEGYKARDRWSDEHGVPYGAQNPPVGVGPRAGAHCIYSAWGCSGRGGSTGPRGYRRGHWGVSPYVYQPYGVGRGPGWGWGCGNHNSRGGAIAAHNGHVSGSLYFNQSRGNCGPNGYGHQSRGGTIGIVNGHIGGSTYWNQSSITP